MSIIERDGHSAARYANSYRGGGHGDWFLPSKNELKEIYIQRLIQVDIVVSDWSAEDINEDYWSSSEYDGKFAWTQDFYKGIQSYNYKRYSAYVRPVRSFLANTIPSGNSIPAIVTNSKSNNFLQHLQTLIESSPDLALSALNTYVFSDISQKAIDIQVDLLLKLVKVDTNIFNFIKNIKTNAMAPGSGSFFEDLEKHYIPNPTISKPATVPIGAGSGPLVMAKLPTFGSQPKFSQPSLNNLNGLSSKIFLKAEPYRGSSPSDIGGFLTNIEFFEMLVHPRLGNFGPALAAIFTAIAQREGNVGENRISIATANGASHLGFLQIRCRPQNLQAFDIKNGWASDSMFWFAPYNEDGEQISWDFKSCKRYAWEAFIKDPKIIKQIKDILLPNEKYKEPNSNEIAKVKGLLDKNMPKVDFVNGPDGKLIETYTYLDRIESSAFIADWARIPANQILMMKSKYGLGPNIYREDVIKSPIIYPYTSQMLANTGADPLELKNIHLVKYNSGRYLLSHWNYTDGKWTYGVNYSVAKSVLNNYGYSDNEIKNMFQNFSQSLAGERKTVFDEWNKS